MGGDTFHSDPAKKTVSLSVAVEDFQVSSDFSFDQISYVQAFTVVGSPKGYST